MSSTTFKNLLQRREHRERAQPAARQKYGLLEKHKDYVQRATNYHDKEKRLVALKRRASMRNPDEHYFAMHSTKTKAGVHTKDRSLPTLSEDELRLMKSQDRTYLQTVISSEQKKIERLQSTLHGLTEGKSGAAGIHEVFPDDVEGARVPSTESPCDLLIDSCLTAAHEDSNRVGGKRSRARTGLDIVHAGDDDGEDGRPVLPRHREAKRRAAPPEAAAAEATAPKRAAAPPPTVAVLAKASNRQYAELSERKQRLAKLTKVLASQTVEASLRSKGHRVKVQDATRDAPAAYRWKAVRSR